jgi:hypothetical protein
LGKKNYYIAISPYLPRGEIYYIAMFPPIQVRGKYGYIAIFPGGGYGGKNGSVAPAQHLMVDGVVDLEKRRYVKIDTSN